MVFYNQHVFFEVIPYLQRLGIAVSRDFSAAVCEFTRHSVFDLDGAVPAGMEYDPFEMGKAAGAAMTEHLTHTQPLLGKLIRGTWCDGNTIRNI